MTKAVARRVNKRSVSYRIHPEVYAALEVYAKRYKLTMAAAVEEIIEDKMIGVGILPEWWKERVV